MQLKNSKHIFHGKALGRERHTVNGYIGAVQMCEPEGKWQDIKPRLVRDTDGWHVEGAPYHAEIKDDGSRLFCPDRNEKSKYLRLPTVPIFLGLKRDIATSPTKLDGQLLPNRVVMPTAWGEIRIVFANTGMKFQMLFRKAPPMDRILLDYDAMGLDIAALLKSKHGLGIPQPRLLELGAGRIVERMLDWSLKRGQLELGFDLSGLRFPVLLQNTTIDEQVDASARDGYQFDNVLFSTTTTSVDVGKHADGFVGNAFANFQNITISQFGQIDVSYVSHSDNNSDAEALTTLYFEDAQDPAAPTSEAEMDAAVANVGATGVNWDGDPGPNQFNNSPSVNPALQENVDAYAHSNHALQVIHVDRGSANGKAQHYVQEDFQEGASAPKIHIEWSLPVGAARGWAQK